MKKIINRKIYNTETAKLLGSWDNKCSYSDYNYYSETLYKTKKGQFFLEVTGGDRLILLDDEEAMEWLEKRDFADLFCELFPDHVSEG
jgi:hypothetical protein